MFTPNSVVVNGKKYDVPSWVDPNEFVSSVGDKIDPDNPLSWLVKCDFWRMEENEDFGLYGDPTPDDPWTQKFIDLYNVEFLIPLGRIAELLGTMFTFYIDGRAYDPVYKISVDEEGVHISGIVNPWIDTHSVIVYSQPASSSEFLPQFESDRESNVWLWDISETFDLRGSLEEFKKHVEYWGGHFRVHSVNGVDYDVLVKAHED